MKFLHELSDRKNLFEIVAHEKNILPSLVEKDYWLMHCLWALQKQGYEFELKGGTSLSKGYGIIERFSEDIDIQIYPSTQSAIKIGRNHNKPNHIEARSGFFNRLVTEFAVPGMQFFRDHHFDDKKKMRSAGIRGEYESSFSPIKSLKSGVLLELGFDQTTPNETCVISSWALDKTKDLGVKVIDNQVSVKCYLPEYTLIEKLQTISTKYRIQQANNMMPVNFLRHYYDIYQLLSQKRVLEFIGTDAYYTHKLKRFRTSDEKQISKNGAFLLPCNETRQAFTKAFEAKSDIYFGEQPSFNEILNKINFYADKL